MSHRLTSFVLVAAALAGCAAPPSVAPTPRAPMSVQASLGRTWDATIEFFAERSIPIRTLERASGLVVTEPMAVSPDDGAAWADCGSGWVAERFPTAASYNVLVRGDSSAATIKVTARWVDGDRACTSRGIYEQELETHIRQRAEQAGPAR